MDDPQIATAVTRLRRDISGAGGAAAAADTVEKALTDTPTTGH
ncbi:hypothetical protein GCM10018785_35800 [Streptomyces longispororuber]|uniref:Uncharacterized protein n=1 Tax=Streptomyces longispororuber TaxID=68230 RepID=A0A918ZPV2_9ACTN|nr:hypothetical protein GCM10018785_35800 [Streptomyces longispororuber]